jgi:prepilin-type processing-associated H-X9-DG protein
LGLAWVMYSGDNQDKLASSDRYLPADQQWCGGASMTPGPEKEIDANASSIDAEALKKGQLYSYLKNTGSYRCAADKTQGRGVDPATRLAVTKPRVRSYSINAYMNGAFDSAGNPAPGAGYVLNRKASDILYPRPADAIVFVCEDSLSLDNGHFGFNPDPAARQWVNFPSIQGYRHSKGSTFGFADGHIEFHKWVDRETLNLRVLGSTVTATTDINWMCSRIATRR